MKSPLSNLLTNRVGEQTHHNLRNNQNFEIPYSRLCSYENSFFPSTLRLWNDLDISTRNSSSLSDLKHRIKQISEKPLHYKVSRDRASEIAFTRIKHTCSSLKAYEYLTNETNQTIYKSVLQFIKGTGRFSYFHKLISLYHKNCLFAVTTSHVITLFLFYK